MRGQFSSRLGFILVSAGCAIGLGNVWRFPYITGKYGGAMFVLFYLVFLAILGLPIMVCEFAVGRGSHMSVAGSFDALEPKGTKWHWYKYGAIAGNMLLMMFYTTISGWMLYYVYKMIAGGFNGLNAEGVGNVFGTLLSDPLTMALYMMAVVLICFGICYLGFQKGVERITKVMMICLLVLLVVLAVNSVLLPGAETGLAYYQWPAGSYLRGYGTGILYSVTGDRRAGYFRKLHRQGNETYRGSYLGYHTGHLCSPHVRADYFPCMLQLWCRSGKRSESAVRISAQCI